LPPLRSSFWLAQSFQLTPSHAIIVTTILITIAKF
jgi:hypothetical protein